MVAGGSKYKCILSNVYHAASSHRLMSNHGVCHFRDALDSPLGSFGTSAYPTLTNVMLQQHIQVEVSAAISEALRGRHSPSRRHHPLSLERERQVT